jgi:hypothetical protein
MDNMMEDNHMITKVDTTRNLVTATVACITEIRNTMIEVAITHNIQSTIEDP